ncbi:MAG: hypothetical protein ACE5IM_11170, partial [Nitrospinota bacterium]
MSPQTTAGWKTHRLRFPHSGRGFRPTCLPSYEVDVISAVPELDGWIARLFSPFLQEVVSRDAHPPEEEDGKPAAFRVFRESRPRRGKRRCRLRLLRPGRRSTSASTPAEMAAYLEYEVFEHVAWNLTGYFQFHAAFLAKGGVGALVPGRTRAGKTTLALSLWQAGWTVYSDDLSLLEPGSGRFVPLPRPFTLRKETLERLRPPALGHELRVGPPDFDEPSAYFHPAWLAPDPGRQRMPEPVGARWLQFPRRPGADLSGADPFGAGARKPELRPLRPSE